MNLSIYKYLLCAFPRRDSLLASIVRQDTRTGWGKEVAGCETAETGGRSGRGGEAARWVE